jgi:hypothetical protein
METAGKMVYQTEPLGDVARVYNWCSMAGFFVEFWDYLKRRKKFWLMPIFAAMILLGGLVVLTKGSAIAPFIYTLF